jgi:hypothetical protein
VDNPVTTVGFGPNSAAKYITTHFRRHFTVTNLAQLSGLTMRIKRDDGAIVYINGREAARPNMTPGVVYSHTTVAPNAVGGADEEAFFTFANLPMNLLQEGDNVIAVEMHQNAASSSDLSFDLELTASRTNAVSDRIVLNKNSVIKARAKTGSEWSGLVEAFFTVNGQAPVASGDVTLSELHYNPVIGLETEFVEVMNVSDHAINLRGCRFTTGFTGAFPTTRDTILAPGQRTVVARSLWDINTTYGLGRPVTALFPKSNLNNGGELVTFVDSAGVSLRTVSYDNLFPWPMPPDGTGPSLTLSAPRANPDLSNPLAWRSSLIAGGTPGYADSAEEVFAGNTQADADGNGYTNLADYAFGNNGIRPTVLPSGQFQMLNVLGVDDVYLTLSLRLNLAASDATVAVEASSDLESWSPDLMTVHERVDHTDGTATVLLRSTQPVSDENSPRLFLRVAVNQ